MWGLENDWMAETEVDEIDFLDWARKNYQAQVKKFDKNT